jgi:hypothetical protein
MCTSSCCTRVWVSVQGTHDNMRVFCSVYLLTAGDGELAGRGAPLPPPELYNPARPHVGLLPMLTAALWQVLWVDAAPGAGQQLQNKDLHSALSCYSPVHRCFKSVVT